MGIGRVLLFLIFVIIVVVGISIAISKTKGPVNFGISPDNEFMRSLLWWYHPKATTTDFVERDFSEMKKVEVNVGEPKKEKEVPPPVPPAGFSEKDLSPFFGMITIKTVTPPNYSNYSKVSGFTLVAGKENKTPLFITDWKIKGNRGAELYIPQGASDYGNTGIPFRDRIALAPNEKAVFYSTLSPVSRNFRLSLCTGYLNNTYAFTPALPEKCPLPYDKAELVTLPGDCQTFIRRLHACDEVKPNDKNRFTGSAYGACREILDRFTYGYCYTRHRGDVNFFTGEWRIWTGVPMPFDPKHDRLILYDNAGLVVDEYTY